MKGPLSFYFYEPKELADLLSVSESTIRRMIRQGKLGAVNVGRQHRIPRSELARLLIEAGLGLDAIPPSPLEVLGLVPANGW